MSDIVLHPTAGKSVTCISNTFIDNYMVDADGEYVKIYLYLLRCVSSGESALSVSRMADFLEHTQKDIKKALFYWEKCGLLRLEMDSENDIKGIFLQDPDTSVPEEKPSTITLGYNPATIPQVIPAPVPVSIAIPNPISEAYDSQIADVLFMAERLIGHTLSKEHVDTILFWHDGLGLSWQLIEYIIEYSVDKGVPHIKYMNSIAVNMADSGITSVDEARSLNASKNDVSYGVKKSFGIYDRSLASVELSMIDKWTRQYGFDSQIINLACDRTMLRTGKASFEYADSILKSWYEKGVKSAEDVASLEFTSQASKSIMIPVKKQTKAASRLHNFPERELDSVAIERKLFQS